MQDEKQKFQSEAQLFALRVHAKMMKVEAFLTYPFRWVLDQFNGTQAFVEKKPHLTLVK